MSIYPDWLEIDIGTGATTIVDALEVDLVDDKIEIEMAAAITVEVVDDTIDMEVC